MVHRIEHFLIEGTCARCYVASSAPAPPSPLCRSVHLRSPTSTHPATIQRDGPGLRGERARRHDSCSCHRPATSLTPHVHLTGVAPTGHDAAATLPRACASSVPLHARCDDCTESVHGGRTQ